VKNFQQHSTGRLPEMPGGGNSAGPRRERRRGPVLAAPRTQARGRANRAWVAIWLPPGMPPGFVPGASPAGPQDH
jgi:hypothetical protein